MSRIIFSFVFQFFLTGLFAQKIVERANIAYGKVVLEMEQQVPKYSLTQYKRVINRQYQYIIQIKDHIASPDDIVAENSNVLLKTDGGDTFKLVTSGESTAFSVFGASKNHYELTVTIEVDEEFMNTIADSGLSEVRFYKNKNKKQDVDILVSKQDNIKIQASKLLNVQLINQRVELPSASE